MSVNGMIGVGYCEPERWYQPILLFLCVKQNTRYQTQMLADVGGFILRIKPETEKPENAEDLHSKSVLQSVDDYSNQK